MQLTYYYNRVAETTRELFIDTYKIKGLIVSGPGPTKEEFVNGSYLEYRLQNMIISTIDSSYSGEEGIREAFVKSGDILSGFRMVEEKKIVDDLIREINARSGLGVYGLSEIVSHLKNRAVKTVIITDDTKLRRVESECNRCHKMREEVVSAEEVIPTETALANNPCPSCNALDTGDKEPGHNRLPAAARRGVRIWDRGGLRNRRARRHALKHRQDRRHPQVQSGARVGCFAPHTAGSFCTTGMSERMPVSSQKCPRNPRCQIRKLAGLGHAPAGPHGLAAAVPGGMMCTCTWGTIWRAALPLFCPRLNASAPVPRSTALAMRGTIEKSRPASSGGMSVIISWCLFGTTKLCPSVIG